MAHQLAVAATGHCHRVSGAVEKSSVSKTTSGGRGGGALKKAIGSICIVLECEGSICTGVYDYGYLFAVGVN
jgi:hypothetical protein